MDAIADHLQTVAEGQIKRLLINVPPGHAESLIVSVLRPAWMWIRNREGAQWRGLFESYAEALAMRVVLGWSLEEIAAQSGAPLNTVRSRLRLAKEGMRRRIEEKPDLVEALEVRS